jgi:hypothetical protein
MIKLKDILKETINDSIDYGYHYTNKKNYEKIKTEGLKINQSMHMTLRNNEWMLDAYGKIPIFLGTKPLTQYGPRIPVGSEYDWVLLKVDVNGLDIAADIGTMIDFGAYIEKDGFWFKQKPFWLNDTEFNYDDLQGSDKLDLFKVINQTKSFVVLEDIGVDRIQQIDYKGKLSIRRFFNIR